MLDPLITSATFGTLFTYFYVMDRAGDGLGVIPKLITPIYSLIVALIVGSVVPLIHARIGNFGGSVAIAILFYAAGIMIGRICLGVSRDYFIKRAAQAGYTMARDKDK